MLEHTQVTYRPQVKVHRFPLGIFHWYHFSDPKKLRPWWLSIASWLNWVGPLSRRRGGPGAPVIRPDCSHSLE